MKDCDSFYVKKGKVYAVPILHYNMETAGAVKRAFESIEPDCVAVEFAETMQDELLHAAERLPDLSVVIAFNEKSDPIYYLSEPCDGCFEGLRSAVENKIPAYCIDLDVDHYPDLHEMLPDPYSIQRIGLQNYYEAYKRTPPSVTALDHQRELYMAQKLKELSFRYDRILFVCGFSHLSRVLQEMDRNAFPEHQHAARESIQIATLTEDSLREVMKEPGFVTIRYEETRNAFADSDFDAFPPDRQRLLYGLYKEAAERYKSEYGEAFPNYNIRNLMKFSRNYSVIRDQLMPDLYQILTTAKGCVDHNYAYQVWTLATNYPYFKNIDQLPELDLSPEELWGASKKIQFHLLNKSKKKNFFSRNKKQKQPYQFIPSGPFTLCSYQPEDTVIERFGQFLRKKGTQVLVEEGSRVAPFSTSLEDGIDTRETIRHWTEKQLYVKIYGKPPGNVGSVVMIFDEDVSENDDSSFQPHYPWCVTWHGENDQESDMAFYATPMLEQVVGPGICRCEYGGFLMTYPPRRLYDIWHDPDYLPLRSKAEVLLGAAIDYAIDPLITYVAAKPPRSIFKRYAQRFGKKVIYLPIGQLSPITLKKIRTFHVLDSKEKRKIADEYIDF